MTAPIEDIFIKLSESGACVKRFDKKSFRAIGVEKLIMMEDFDILRKFNSIIRGIVNYYSFVNSKSNLWGVLDILKKSCALTLARKHKLGSAQKAFHKYGPNLKINSNEFKDLFTVSLF